MEAALDGTDDIGEGEMRAYEVAIGSVLVCRVAGELFAVENACSHADTPLSDGTLEGYLVTCPLHFAQFDVRDGLHQCAPAYTGIRSFAISQSGVLSVAENVPRPGPPEGPLLTR